MTTISTPNINSKEMKVLVLGLCRTGTQSIATALETLGFTPIYHMKEVLKNNHQDAWLKAIEAKFEGKGAWGGEEWRNLLGDFEGVADIPAAMFAEELIKEYPDAKVILTVRDEDAW